MTRLPDLASGFKALREIDLNSIRNQAEAPFHLSVIGDIGVGKSTLITQLLLRPGVRKPLNPVPISEQRLDQDLFIQSFSVVILMLDATQPEHLLERQVFERLRSYKVPIIVGYNKSALLENDHQAIFTEALRWPGSEFIAITASDRQTLLLRLVPALLRIYKGREVLLARHVPMVREPVSRKLIEDTSFINATYIFPYRPGGNKHIF
jgi:predicted GTPase